MDFCHLLKIRVESSIVNIVRNFLIMLQMQLQLPQKEQFKKIAEATGDLTGNKIANKITRSSKTSPQNNFEINEEPLREKYISLELKQKIIV